MKVDTELVIPDPSKSLSQGAIAVSGWNVENEDAYSRMFFNALASHYKFKLDTPVGKLPQHIVDIILYGTKGERIKVIWQWFVYVCL